MKRIFVFLFVLFFSSLVVNAQTDPLEKLKQDVLSGKVSISQAKGMAAKMGLEKSSVSSLDKMNSRDNKVSDDLKKFKSKLSLFLTPSYFEFSKNNVIDSVEILNTSSENLSWVIENNLKWLNIYDKENSVVDVLKDEIKYGESKFLKFGVNIPDKFDIPEDGLKGDIVFRLVNGDSVKLKVCYLPELKEEGLKYFGYNIFRGAYKMNLNDVGPTDPNYIVTIGDQINISIWGQVEQQIPLTVSNDGTVFIQNVGQVKLVGESLADLKIKLANIMSSSYSSLSNKGGKQSSFIDVSLSKITSFPVYVVGSVKKPGVVRVNSMSTVMTALYAAGGVEKEGSLREIEVLRGGKLIGKVDLYNYLVDGNLTSDIRLSAKDVVRVPIRKSSVTIEGEINREMIYELKEKETLQDLVHFAGGVKSTTDPSIVVIDRLAPSVKEERLRTMIKGKLGEKKNGKILINDLPIFDTDTVMLYAFKGRSLDFAIVNGAVYREGKYAITEGMKVKDLLKDAGGLRSDAFLDKADIVRTLDDGNREFLKLDLSDGNSLNTLLKSRDSLYIYSREDFKINKFVEIEGHIPAPNKFMFAEGMMFSDVLMKAGGLEDELFRKQTYIERADIVRFNENGLSTYVVPVNLKKILDGDKSADLKLKGGDRLIIYDASMLYTKKILTVEGAVNSPGEYELQTNMTLKDIIVRAKGFKYSAYKVRVEVFRVNPFDIKPNELSIVKTVELKDGLLSAFNSKSDFLLQNNDVVVVRQYPSFEYQRKVYIKGEVKYPGFYSILRQGETLVDLIDRAGGLSSEAYVAAIDFRRDSVRLIADFEKVFNSEKNYNVVLHSNDTIIIPKRPGIVKIEGFVNSPGIIQYRKDWSLAQYIEAAGDYTFDAARSKTLIYYPGGAAKRKGGLFGSPRIKDGSTIIVPRKPQREEGYWLGFIAKVSSVVASVATTIFLITK